MIELIYLLGFSALIFIAYYSFAACLKLENTDKIVAAFILSFFQIIVTETVLGVIGKLNSFYGQIANAIICSAILGFSLRQIRKQKLSVTDFNLKDIRLNTNATLLAALIVFAYSLIFFLAVIIPPYSWDSLTYHLPDVFNWTKSGKLVLTQPVRDASFFPQNGELLTLWIYLLTKKIHYLNLAQFPFAFLFAVSTYNIAKRLKLEKAFMIFGLVLLAPVVMIQAAISYVDIIFAGFFMATLSLLVGYTRTKRNVFLVLAGIAAGMTCGIKPVGWALALIFLGYLSVICFIDKKYLRSGSILLAALSVICAGGFWYIRNLILTGNINFPFTINLFGIEIVKGVKDPGWNLYFEKWFVSEKWQWWFYPFYDSVRGTFNYSIESGFGIQFVFGLVSIFFSIYIAIAKKDRLSLFIFLLFPVTIIFIFMMRTCPVPRYVIFLCGISALAVIYVRQHLKPYYKKLSDILIVFVVLFSFSTAIFQINPCQKKVITYILSHKNLPVYTYLSWEYGDLAQAWKWIDENTKPGTVIAYNYPQLITYLYGVKVDKDIVNIDTSGDSYEIALRVDSYEDWIQKLRKFDASYLFVFPRNENGVTCKDFVWAEGHPETFRELKRWSYLIFGEARFYKMLTR